jgi:hypothetical protein
VHMLTCRRCGGLTPPGSSSACLHCDAPLPRSSRRARRLAALLGPAGSILLAACYGGPGRYHDFKRELPDGVTRPDRDHDGARGPYECAPGVADCAQRIADLPPPNDIDCDDGNAAIFPGALDVAGDGVDSNCDGVDGVDGVDTAKRPPAAAAPGAAAPGAPPAAPPAGSASPPAKVARPPASP